MSKATLCYLQYVNHEPYFCFALPGEDVETAKAKARRREGPGYLIKWYEKDGKWITYPIDKDKRRRVWVIEVIELRKILKDESEIA